MLWIIELKIALPVDFWQLVFQMVGLLPAYPPSPGKFTPEKLLGEYGWSRVFCV